MDIVESRLYYNNAFLREFDTPVVEQFPVGEGVGIVLQRTAFYPTSGGQPHDTGQLDGLPVVDVFEREADQAVVHVVPQRLSGPSAHGQIDWVRRFDFMQQHTGQHILSHAAEDVFDADTVGFHLTEDTLTIDLNRAPLSMADGAALEERANAMIFADLPVVTAFRTQAEVSQLRLRKPPAVSGPVRIVSIADLDFSPCGGTHCSSTGAVGQIVIQKIERRGSDSRVEFVCGGRALANAQRSHRLVSDLAAQFSVGPDGLIEAVVRTVDETKSLRHELKSAEDRLLHHQAIDLVRNADMIGETRLVKAVFAERDPAWMKYLALRLMEFSHCMVLLGLIQDGRAQLTFARSADLAIDVRPLLREACQHVGGGGGGQPSIAQGGGPAAENIELALNAASQVVRTLLAQ
jgi:alanyl-tRNA synthetase